MHEARQHLFILRDSVMNLEVGQTHNEVMMEMLVGAHNISAESLQERMVAAKERLTVSEQHRGLLFPAASPAHYAVTTNASPGTEVPSISTRTEAVKQKQKLCGASRSPTNVKRPVPEPPPWTAVNLFVDNVYNQPLYDLPVTVLQKMLIELSGHDAMESFKNQG